MSDPRIGRIGYSRSWHQWYVVEGEFVARVLVDDDPNHAGRYDLGQPTAAVGGGKLIPDAKVPAKVWTALAKWRLTHG